MTIQQVANFVAEFTQKVEENGVDENSKPITAQHMVYMLNARDERDLNHRISEVAMQVFPF